MKITALVIAFLLIAGVAGAEDSKYEWLKGWGGLKGTLVLARITPSTANVVDTGFKIKLRRDNGVSPYAVVDPDGRESLCFTLDSCKEDAEKAAKERSEFD